ncbi:MAG TPA: 16S rRNA (guanine(966)-N(2))-methyltransferase RsmD [Flavobacteriaceae bacterium]|jgi:16S rRNA (guanine(966)-N(2))-methyltransferase RsmD|nr:16S rRNA (guanine(966)-N(2))-methyltransferase RsmD [Flavobacteriaceae bacterium]HBS12981.1 16S rRNA (guanine(966)-N(2))-methyltransferase RsmD [Flavobacteriaceae bacterium]
MRIISGKHKGKRITAPKKLPTRPTTDLAKESLFNILNNLYYFEGLSIIDLFAGIGSISFEFASRGAKNIISVDQHYGCVKFINLISEECSMEITTIKNDVYKFLKKNTVTADIIFADPPYSFSDEQFLTISTLVFSKDILNENGLLIIEHSKDTDLSNNEHFSYSKRYGGSMFSFFELN